MNKKGFTLIELLAVIIILALLALLASTSITGIVKDSKTDLYDSQIELIKASAQMWGADNLNRLPSAGECAYITLKQLKDYGLLDEVVTNPKTNKEFLDTLPVKITTTTTKYNTLKIEYEVDVSTSGCYNVYDESVYSPESVE